LPNTDPSVPRPSHDEIARRAFQMFLERGGEPGREMGDWIAAEIELTAAYAAAAGDRPPADPPVVDDPPAGTPPATTRARTRKPGAARSSNRKTRAS
jgi:hypothetical protein